MNAKVAKVIGAVAILLTVILMWGVALYLKFGLYALAVSLYTTVLIGAVLWSFYTLIEWKMTKRR